MARRGLTVVLFALLLVAASVGGSAQSTESDGFADVLVGDLVIGESEQEFPGMRAVEFPADAETVRLELDLGVLTDHGVDVSDAEVVLASQAVHGATVDTATVEDGQVRFVFAPDESIDDTIIEVEEFRLVGLDTADAEAAEGLTFDATFSAGEARVRSFDIIDPDRVTATLDPQPLFTGARIHRVTLHDVHAAGENVTLTLDVAVLEDHGFALSALEADVTADGATVKSATVTEGVVSIDLSPATGTVLFDVRVELGGLERESTGADRRVLATGVSYAVTLEGAAGDEVAVQPFDINTHPTTHADPVTTGTPTSDGLIVVKGDGFGPALTVAALALILSLARRRR